MSNTERRKILNYRNASGISPNPDNIDYGEIAIGYKKDNEAIYIKNTTNEIVDFTPISIVNLTYNELKNLRDNSKLKPSQYYRITDFVTTVANDPEARSAGHPFDIVLLALSANKLAEEGWAMMHDNTYDVTFADDGYTKKCWIYDYGNGINIVDCESLLGFEGLGDDEITINQEQKTAVCHTLGTGDLTDSNVAYNYFQNSKLEAWKIWYCLDNDTTKYMWADTTNGKGVIYRMIDEWGNDCPYDFKNVQFKRYWTNGINIAKAGEPKDIILQGYYGIVSNTDIFTEGIDAEDYLFCFTFTRLNNIFGDYEKGSVIQSNVLDESIQTEGLDTDAKDDKLNNPSCYKLHNRCRNNILKPTETGLVVDTKEYMTFILLNNVFITVKEYDYEAYHPSFDNTLGSSCVNNTFGSSIYGLLFLSRCINNTFGNNCYSNVFGNNCYSNVFGDYCYNNSFGNNCNSNSFGTEYSYNTFGNYCSGNSFGNGCMYNSFGNDCRANSFRNYFRYNALGNDVQHIAIPTDSIYCTQILNGTHGEWYNKLTIAFTPATEYSQFAGFTSDGVLKIWVEADDDVAADDDIVNLTYNELKNLRDNSKLKPSQYYRITDFVTTVANDPEARSAGHPFDLIVLALDKNKLHEQCHAIHHESDTYFADCNLAAWKIWYCLDNDTTKYAWADTVNGKGVIYRMIDEWGNDCPYDFKNVQFKRYWTNGFSIIGQGTTKDIILQGYYSTVSNKAIDKNDYLFCFTFTRLNNILANYEKGSVIQSNVLDESIQTEGLDTDTKDDKLNNQYGYNFHNRCRNNILKPTETGLVVDTKEYMTFILLNNVFITVKESGYNAYHPSFDNTLGSSCVNNTFGSNIYGLLFLSRCINNTFGNDCYGNSFGNNCRDNLFGNDCHYNQFGNECIGNSFGNYCYNNSFGNNCSGNSFGNDCRANSFGKYCYDNSFRTKFMYNSFGTECSYSSFGNNCMHNSFGNGCLYNSFGNDCVYNSFGKDCQYISFGKDCSSNTFGNKCSSNTFGNEFKYNALGNYVMYIAIPTDKIYHTQILNGTHGGYTNKLTIAFTPETEYSQFAGFTSDGVLEIWVEADDPHDGIDCGDY